MSELWNNPRIQLFHGTIEESAAAIVRDGINPLVGRPNTDFGSGFYTTTWLPQARAWAIEVAQRRQGRPAMVQVMLDRLVLRSFRSLAFVRGAIDAFDYWSFVEHCRTRATQAPLTGEYYDTVYGPVALRWGPARDQYETLPGMDQVSFHGKTAGQVLRGSSVCKVEVIEWQDGKPNNIRD